MVPIWSNNGQVVLIFAFPSRMFNARPALRTVKSEDINENVDRESGSTLLVHYFIYVKSTRLWAVATSNVWLYFSPI
jgi:hypothetical protein